MAIDRRAAAGMDISTVSTGRKLKPVHPGEVLRKDFIAREVTPFKLAA